VVVAIQCRGNTQTLRGVGTVQLLSVLEPSPVHSIYVRNSAVNNGSIPPPISTSSSVLAFLTTPSMFPINVLFLFALVLSTLTGAEPWLNLLTSNIIECGRVRFSCGGGRPPYRLTMLVSRGCAYRSVLLTSQSPSLKNVYSNINADGVWEVPMPCELSCGHRLF